MSRIRSVKPEWLEDERMAMASSDARVLSIALILLADDFGNGRAGRATLAARVFPGAPLERFDAALNELVDSVKFTTVYEVDGQRYFSIRNWSKHQRVDHPGKPQVPSPPEDSKKSRPSSRKSRESLAKTPESLGEVVEGLAPRAIPSPPIPSEGVQGESERETVCPLDLERRCETANIPEQFAQAYGTSVDAVRSEIREVVTYWTIGGGSGKRKRNWLATVRTRLHERGKQGMLTAQPVAPKPSPEEPRWL